MATFVIPGRWSNMHLLPAASAVDIIVASHASDGGVLEAHHTPGFLVLVRVLVGPEEALARSSGGSVVLGLEGRSRGHPQGIEGAESPEGSQPRRNVIFKVVSRSCAWDRVYEL